MASSVSASSLVSCRLAPAIVIPSGPPLASTTRLRFTPFSPGPWGFAPPNPPPAGFAHGGVGRLPLPVHPAQRVTGLDQRGPEACQQAVLAPLLEVAMHRAVIPKARRELIPLAAGAQTEDNAIQHTPEIGPSMPLAFGRIVFVQNRLDERPNVIGNFPDGRLLLVLSFLL